ncbi:FG-GAP repeat protein [Pseudomarimonas salicorniae]|uniref:FG-GAP repeat protein n=1 Tax=Pseudomarimonas salicorniae TaxID=2933270 RepID=A0ABT0GGI7_9GAMM|nr:FG-GAP repeat protein [Lysobacter sp. CAU 1642]MCK7593462.1 FG-GAP repeat protein [Lysobacter sp. CAU 1642]
MFRHVLPALGWMVCLIGLQAGPAQALPGQLDSADWSLIRSAMEAPAYTPRASAAGFTAGNPEQGYRLRFGADGQTEVTPSDVDVDFTVRIRPLSIGYADERERLDTPLSQRAEEGAVHTQWTPSFREWWENRPSGAQQWFELARRPAGGAEGAPLEVLLDVQSSLQMTLEGDLPNQYLRLFDTRAELRYQGLKVWDAQQRELPARMVLHERQLALQIDDRGAVYPVTIDPTLVQQAYLKASNARRESAFGFSVAVSGDTVAVGAPREDTSSAGINGPEDAEGPAGVNSGAVYVFVREGLGWRKQAFIKAGNAGRDDRFGVSVALSGDTLVVGAPLEDSEDDALANSGAAYVFVREAGVWRQQALLKASNADPEDYFGERVAISGDTLVVGALGEDSSATTINGDASDNTAPDSGAAYVFVRVGDSWAEQAYLKSSNAGAVDEFGSSVAVSGDTVLVGAPGEDSNASVINGDELDNSAPQSGAAYVFRRTGDTWSQQAYLKASNAGPGDGFGTSVALSMDTAAVGAAGESSGHASSPADESVFAAGAAYVFVSSDGQWTEQAYLKAEYTGGTDYFGTSLALSGDRLVVGAPGESSNAKGVDGDATNELAPRSGAAYLFTRAAGLWSQQAYLKASNTDAGDAFGFAAAISGETVVVGAYQEDSAATGENGDQGDNSAEESGAIYLFGAPTYSIGGTVSGLTGSGLVLRNNGGDDLVINANGPFSFPTSVIDGGTYAVTVHAQPGAPAQACTVGNGNGAVSGEPVVSVAVTCTYVNQMAHVSLRWQPLGGLGKGPDLHRQPGKGQPLRGYALTLTNRGPVPLSAAELRTVPQRGLEDLLWDCTPQVPCSPVNGSGDVRSLTSLDVGQSVTVELTGTVSDEVRFVELIAQLRGENVADAHSSQSRVIQRALIDPVSPDGLLRSGFE